MRKPSRILGIALFASLLSLALAIYGATVSPADPPPSRPAPSLSASRFFVLLPDGRVEITDTWSRRVFRWDGERWVQLESIAIPRPDAR